MQDLVPNVSLFVTPLILYISLLPHAAAPLYARFTVPFTGIDLTRSLSLYRCRGLHFQISNYDLELIESMT